MKIKLKSAEEIIKLRDQFLAINKHRGFVEAFVFNIFGIDDRDENILINKYAGKTFSVIGTDVEDVCNTYRIKTDEDLCSPTCYCFWLPNYAIEEIIKE